MIPPESHDNTVLVVRRVFTAPRQRVFRAWIEPCALERWLRPKGLGMTVNKLEARVGGSFRFDLERGRFPLSGNKETQKVRGRIES